MIEKLHQEKEVDRDFYDTDDVALQNFEEALEDGWSFLFNLYGHDAPDKDEEYEWTE